MSELLLRKKNGRLLIKIQHELASTAAAIYRILDNHQHYPSTLSLRQITFPYEYSPFLLNQNVKCVAQHHYRFYLHMLSLFLPIFHWDQCFTFVTFDIQVKIWCSYFNSHRIICWFQRAHTHIELHSLIIYLIVTHIFIE